MVPAAELKTGMILRIEKHLYRILATEYHTGAGKMGGLVHAKLREVRSGLLLDKKFKPEEKLDGVELDRKKTTGWRSRYLSSSRLETSSKST